MLRPLALIPVVALATALVPTATGRAAPAGPSPARAAAVTNVPATFGARVDRARRASGVRVLLPGRIDTEFARLYPGGSWGPGRYALDLGAVRGCHQATACFVAAFMARRGGTVSGERRVTLARGRTGRFTPTHCGASCAAPEIQWRERGVRYTIQAKIGTERTERKRLIALANAAIRAGAR